MNPARLSNWCLLAGIVAGFALCVGEGHRASRYSKPDGFRRFAQPISPDMQYYPPYAMLEALALARYAPGKTLVIVGGNSIFNGVSQPRNDVWTLRLQSLLGERYVVVNLAFRGSHPAEGAALVAEALQRRGLPVVFVTNTSTVGGSGRAVGGPYAYLFWQARAAGRLAPYAPREQALARWFASLKPADQEPHREAQLAGQLESTLRPQSLWHHSAYRHFFTVWNSIQRADSWQPRASIPDAEPRSLPLELRFQHYLAEEMAIVRSFSAGLAERDAAGRWQMNQDSLRPLGEGIEEAFVPELRARTLVIINQNAPYYRERLTAEERARDEFVAAACAQLWRDHGIACEVVGGDFAPIDFHDRTHLSVEGGNRLAEIVARRITRLNPP